MENECHDWDLVPPFTYIGVSKLSSSACSTWIQVWNNQGGPKFNTREAMENGFGPGACKRSMMSCWVPLWWRLCARHPANIAVPRAVSKSFPMEVQPLPIHPPHSILSLRASLIPTPCLLIFEYSVATNPVSIGFYFFSCISFILMECCAGIDYFEL